MRELNRHAPIWVLVLLLSSFSCDGEGREPDLFAGRIARFQEQDLESPPTPGGIVFIGSSTIQDWDLAEAFPGLPAVNRGLGSSRARDLSGRLDVLIAPHRPSVVVTYLGDNDVSSGLTAEEVVRDVTTLLDGIQELAPGADFVMLSIKPSPRRTEHFEAMRRTNELLHSAVSDRSDVVWVDVFSALLDESGTPRSEYFEEEGLHLSAEGYAVLQSFLDPILRS